ncbi:hypothetical protein [Paenarthrobacter aromaticivorans]|uniref:hypothetical protein n=1 Tax=Paenarthrobacter aromaticivorans TaxID=2849150 RepID=UPI003A8103F6
MLPQTSNNTRSAGEESARPAKKRLSIGASGRQLRPAVNINVEAGLLKVEAQGPSNIRDRIGTYSIFISADVFDTMVINDVSGRSKPEK